MNTAMAAVNADTINSILSQREDSFSVVFREIPKSSGPRDAYVLLTSTRSASPIVYADDVKTMTPSQIADYMEEVYKNAQLEFDGEKVMDASYILQHVMPHIAGEDKGDYLRKSGYSTVPFHNMIVTFAIEMEGGFFLLTDKLMQDLGIRYEQIIPSAKSVICCVTLGMVRRMTRMDFRFLSLPPGHPKETMGPPSSCLTGSCMKRRCA